ncbi:MAG: DUF479 domain-containing protein [Coprobacter sp.]|nr:DUF479 domain-containing protein [Coprobacter sp.]
MNYLAHIFLSGSSPACQVGGFIADAVKGRYDSYPSEMQQGIGLHRKIDAFTDGHLLVKGLLADLRPRFGRYSVILPDLFFDHFLAARFSEYSSVPLWPYTIRFYSYLLWYYRQLPKRYRRFLWHFMATNRLYRYRTVQGLTESLQIMVDYGEVPMSPVEVERYLIDNYAHCESLFRMFFQELQCYLKEMEPV